MRRPRDVRFRNVDGEAIVVRQSAAEVLVLNEVAARLLTLADGIATVANWVETLAEEYEVDRAVLERDVRGFAAELVQDGLLEPVPLAAAGASHGV